MPGIEANAGDLSLIALFFEAHIVVKIVMLGLIGASVWCWAIIVDKTELDDARWFTREAVADAIEASDRGEAGSTFQCPPRFAVANFLLRWWLDRR